MIKASNFTLDKVQNHLVARCNVSGPGLPKVLWFAAECDDDSALEIDEPNWAAVSLIYPAMGLGQDLVIDAKISPRLLYNLNNDFQHMMRTFNPNLQHIKVIADTDALKTHAGDVTRHAITGFSGGVDSSATYALYSGDEVPESMRINALSIYDVGALGKTPKNPSFEHLQPHFDNLKRFCDAQEITALGISSNLKQVLHSVRKVHPDIAILPATVSLRNIAATMAMQSRVKLYYPSGNSGYSDVQVKKAESTECFEPVLGGVLSTETLLCQAGGAGLDRSDKIKLIASAGFAQSGLNVCVGDKEQRSGSNFLNCGKCWKCVDTQFEADGMGVLENFSDVFDVTYFLENRDEILTSFLGNNVYYQHKTQQRVEGFAELYRSHGQGVPAKLQEIMKQLDHGTPISNFIPPKVKKSRLSRLLAKVR